jgi:glycosyltransferase involved in cell wall biosynthesis
VHVSGRRRLCFFLNSWTYGGVEEHVALLCEKLPALGYELLVVCDEIEPLRPLHDRLDAAGVRRVALPVGRGPMEKIKFIARFARLLREERVELMHVQLIFSEGGRLPILAGGLARVPIVVTHHAAPRQPLPFLDLALRTPLVVGVKRFIAVSRANQADQARFMHLPAKRLSTVHNGIVVSASAPDRESAHRQLCTELGLPDDSPLIGAIGRLSVQKGFSRLIDAIPAIVSAIPNARILFIGDGPLRAELQAQVARLAMQDNVVWMGFRRDVPRLLGGLDVLAMPSLWEGLPLALLEAFAAGCPAVATAVDGIPEVIDHGVNGFLIPPDRLTELAPRIVELLSSRDLALAMSRAARSKAEASFTVELMVENMLEIYDETLAPAMEQAPA